MKEGELGDLALATALLVIAGFVDAVGFLTLGHLFVSFESGNSTQFAIAIGGNGLNDAAPAGVLILSFVAGVAGGRFLALAAQDWLRPAILLVEAALLAVAALLPLGGARPAYLMALAMGAQNSVIRNAGATQTALTYVTGTLVHLGQNLADAVWGAGPRGAWLPYLALWIALLVGGALGGAAYWRMRLDALLIAVAAILVLAAVTAWPKLHRTVKRRS
jgi:uncharacterized membrane protein YoaK (UPF0700 family)